MLQSTSQCDGVTAALRDVEGEELTVIWPEGSKQEFAIVYLDSDSDSDSD